jgi:quercetin dioxygenase-like cupin family protein
MRSSGPSGSSERVAGLVDPRDAETLEVLGPVIRFLVPPDDDGAPCVMRGTIAPGGVVPLHRHADPETFIALEGEVEGWLDRGGRDGWARVAPGDVVHVPGGVGHAWRNPSPEPAVSIIVTTATLGRFFREVGTRAPAATAPTASPPPDAAVERFLAVAERYGYWNATPEENAAIGLRLG